MKIVPNPYLLRFTEPPPADASRTVARLHAIGEVSEADGSWSDYAVSGTVATAAQPGDGFMSRYGTDPVDARRTVEREVSRLRLLADAAESRLGAYGPGAFVQRLEAVRIGAGDTPAGVLHRASKRQRHSHVRVCNSVFELTAQGLRGVPSPAD